MKSSLFVKNVTYRLPIASNDTNSIQLNQNTEPNTPNVKSQTGRNRVTYLQQQTASN